VRNFERRSCSPEDFAAGVVADWSLPISPRSFLDSFRSWVAAPFPGAEELVQTVKRAVPVGCLSNTNVAHWPDCAAHWPLMDLFDFRFLSFELGLLKPDREVFEHVVGATDISASRLLFLDDNLVNVESARDVGLEAVQVRGAGEARRAVTAAGLL
jgi:putative hydrolase of the HAD superfamily